MLHVSHFIIIRTLQGQCECPDHPYEHMELYNLAKIPWWEKADLGLELWLSTFSCVGSLMSIYYKIVSVTRSAAGLSLQNIPLRAKLKVLDSLQTQHISFKHHQKFIPMMRQGLIRESVFTGNQSSHAQNKILISTVILNLHICYSFTFYFPL